ncbi:MAG: type 4a pilus biogenesis protein PilO [Desulfobacterales bacterium]
MKKIDISFDFLDPLIEKFEKLTKTQRLLIYGATFAVLIGSFVWLSIMPSFSDINRLGTELKDATTKLDRAKRTAMQLNSWRGKMAQAETRLGEVAKALPEKQEIPSLLTSISRSGQDAGLEFLLFQPRPEIPRDFYAEIPLALRVAGNYHAVAIFFDKVSKLSRIVNIRDIVMRSSDRSEKLETECTAVTYKFIEAAPPEKK